MASDSDHVDLEDDVYFRCCKKLCKVVICINCGAVFHTSCAGRYKQLKYIDETRVQCCKSDKLTLKSSLNHEDEIKNIVKNVCSSIKIHPNESLTKENAILSELVKELQEKNKLLRDKIESLSVLKVQQESVNKNINFNSSLTYAEQVKKKRSIYEDGQPLMLVKPKVSQESKVTKSEIQNKVNLSNIEVGIRQVKENKNGSVVIACNNKEELVKLRNETIVNIGNDYDVEIREPRIVKPCLKIFGITQQIEKDELIHSIKKQNRFIHSEADIEVLMIKEVGGHSDKLYKAILSVDKITYDEVMKIRKLNIGWARCAVYEHITITQCFNCYKFNHKSANCKSKTVCPKCMGDHSSNECTNKSYKCANCMHAIDVLGIKDINPNHAAWNVNCPCYQHKIKLKRDRIIYE